MASRQSTVDFVLEQIAGAGVVSARKMFGEYGVYCGEKMVALVCEDQLYIKPTAAGKAFAGDVTEGCPYPGAKPCLLISGDRWENRDWLTQLVRITATELSAPKKKATPKAKDR